MIKTRLYILFLFLNVVLFSQGENFVREIEPFTIIENGEILNNTFSGGANNPEFQFVDIDADEDYDLFILNSDGLFVQYQNKGDKFNAQFELNDDTLKGLKVFDWFYFVDFDDDSDFDLFTGSKGSKVSYLENTGSPFAPSFELKIDTVRNSVGNDLIGEIGSNAALADIDNDNDFDFISGNFSGSAYFYENIGTPSKFEFDTLDSKWQDLQIGGNLILKSSRHGASSIEFADIDDDNDLDLFWGDMFNTSLYLVRNYGTPENPDMQIDTKQYPGNADSISTRGFNMPRLVDIDGDGDFDLFSSILFNDISNKSTVAFRENKGMNNFELDTDDFLNSLDVGSRSDPELIDIDADGDFDLFIGSESLNDGTIYYYENIGSASQPIFELRDSNYYEITGELSLSPSFGDLDNDGDFDLLVADSFNGIDLYKNTGNKFVPDFNYEGKLQNNSSMDLDPGIYAKIKLCDFDIDGDLDLIIGNFSGSVKVYRNVGTPSNYSFEPDEGYLDITSENNYSYATLFDFDKDNVNELFIGSDNGKLVYYENSSNQSPNFFVEDNSFLENSFGKEPNIEFVDIDDDGDDDIFVGNIKGGIYFYRNMRISSVKNDRVEKEYDLKIKSYPNPFNSTVQIEITLPKNTYYSLKIFNILGEEVLILKEGTSAGEKQNLTWNVSKMENKLTSGVYFLTLSTELVSKTLPVQYLK